MATITVWLLISLGSTYSSGSPTAVVEKFASLAECQRVAAVLNDGLFRRDKHQCVQAAILR